MTNEEKQIIYPDEGQIEKTTRTFEGFWVTGWSPVVPRDSEPLYHMVTSDYKHALRQVRTHIRCEYCGNVYEHNAYCGQCHERREMDKLMRMPVVPWDGGMVCYDYDSYDGDLDSAVDSSFYAPIELERKPIDKTDYETMIRVWFDENPLYFVNTEKRHPKICLENIIGNFYGSGYEDEIPEPSDELCAAADKLNGLLAKQYCLYFPKNERIDPAQLAEIYLDLRPYNKEDFEDD